MYARNNNECQKRHKRNLKGYNDHKKEKRKIELTPNSQAKPITQDTPQQTPRDEELNNIIEKMDIENTLTRGKRQLLLKKIRTKKKIKKLQKKLTVNPRPKQEPALGNPDKKDPT